MDDSSLVQSLAKFYYFAFMSEPMARRATILTLGPLKKSLSKNDINKAFAPSFVHTTNESWQRLKIKKQAKKTTKPDYEMGWLLPEGVSVGPWKQFQREAQGDELLAVIWSHVLKISDEDISQGLGVTLGTARHRVGRGLRHLGSLMTQGSF